MKIKKITFIRYKYIDPYLTEVIVGNIKIGEIVRIADDEYICGYSTNSYLPSKFSDNQIHYTEDNAREWFKSNLKTFIFSVTE